METKVIKKRFYLADFMEVQKFLTKQHKEGWNLTSQIKNRFIFEKCKPESYIYQIDLNDDNKDEEKYIQMFKDYGWEYIQKSENWYYFRKHKSKNELENEIFSDNASKAEMCKKTLEKQNRYFIPIYIVILAWNYLIYFTDIFKVNSAVFTSVLIIGSICILGVVYKLGVFIYNINKLRKIIHEYQTSLGQQN